ncbi:uncharacterized protein LOC135489534 [Lineus longissimus]|uniref:uncharacterized protein LOC135489534 n=1 Tax=Lineus longissimus TaxID=88925 RepID=UPI00315D1957
MFRSMSKMAKTSTSFTRWAPLGFKVNMRQHITRRPQVVPARLLASSTANNNRRNDSLEPKIGRKLGNYENFLFETGRENGWSTFCCCAVFRSEMELTPEQMKKAFENLQKRHAVFRLVVTLKDGENYFAEVADAPNYEILQTSDRRAVIARAEQNRFTYGQLLMRFKVLTPETSDRGFLYPVIIAAQTCAFDGKTLKANVLTDLAYFLEKALLQDGDDNIESLPMLPVREDLLDQYPDSRSNNLKPNDWNTHKDLLIKLLEMHKPSHPQPCSGITGFVLDKEQNSQLLHEVAQHNVSLNSVCVAAHAMALYRLQIDLGLLSDQGWSLQSPFAADMRPYAKPKLPGSHAGVWVAEFTNHIIIPAKMASCNSKEALWKLAASIHKETRELTADPEPTLGSIKGYNEFHKKFMSDRQAYYRDDGYPAQDLFYISNFGKLPNSPGKGKVSLDEVELITGTTGSTMFIHDIHRLNSSSLFHWELSYSKMFVSDELAEKYLSLIKEELERYLME